MSAYCTKRGIVLPLFAVFLSLLTTLVFLVTINTSAVRRARADLWRKVDNTCRDLTYDPSNAHKIAQSFSFNVQNMITQDPIPGAAVTDARVIVPTLLEGDLSGSLGGGSACSTPVNYHPRAPYSFTEVDKEFDYNQTSLDPCDSSGKTHCYFRWKLCDEHDDRLYPESMWNQFVNSGNTIACEATAVVRQYLATEVTINVRSAWMRRARDEPDYYSVSSPQLYAAPALTFLIAPELTTWSASDSTHSGDARFEFVQKAPPYFPAPPSLSHLNVGFDPLFSRTSSVPPVPALSGFSGLNPPASYLSTTDKVSGHPELAANDAKEMLVSCSNPAVLIRNIASSLLVELASRNGQFRTMTEVLLANPQHRHRPPSALPAQFNGPTVISSFLDDISLPKFRVPYIFYEHSPQASGLDSNINPLNRPPTKGWLNPFLSSPYLSKFPAPNQEKWLEYHSLIATQLRACYHLYYGLPALATTRGLERYRLVRIHDPENRDFEPSQFGYSRGVTNYFASTNYTPDEYTPNFDSWDQRCSWQNITSCSPDSPRTKMLSAAETVSVLGSIQSCPYPVSNGGNSTLPVCTKPVARTPSNRLNIDLQPDYLGSFSYILKTNPDNSQPSIPIVKAIKAPGIFPLSNPEPAQFAPNPFIPSHYAPPPLSSESHIIVIAHQLPTDAQLTQLQRMFEGSDERYVTFLYFPTQAVDADDNAIRKLTAIFDAPPARMLFAFTPYLTKYQSESRLEESCFGTGTEAECFQAYWDMLLDPSSEDYIVYNARRIFFQRILTLKQIF